MAARALGLGPNGFSFDASLMMLVMPSSRSSSSMGFPGTYGARVRTLSTARAPGDIPFSIDASGNRSRVRTQHAEQRRALLEPRERLRHVRIVRVTVDVEEEHVVPLLAARWPRLDARQAHLVLGERLEQAVERARRVGVQPRAEDGCAVVARGLEHLATDDEEARRVVVAVFDLGGEKSQSVDVGRGLAGNRGGALFVTRAARAFGIARYRHPRHVRQMFVEP